jgi:hypothetical protein
VLKAGEVLGAIGFSGQTAFPHLHLTVRKGDTVLDPFTSQPTGTNACNIAAPKSLWAQPVAYNPTALLGAGFTTKTPNMEGVQKGKFNESILNKNAEFLIAWVNIMGTQPADVLRVRILSPDGSVFLAKEETFAAHKAVQFAFVGRKRQGGIWPSGTYTGTLELIRAGKQVFSHQLEIKAL